MVLVALHHTHGSVYIGTGPIRIVGYGVVAVTFLVGLVHNVQSVIIVESVHLRIIGIVTGTYDVHVVAFVHQNILYHRLHRNGLAILRMYVMTVGTLEIG